MASASDLDAATAEVAFDFEKQATEMRTYWDQPLATKRRLGRSVGA